MLSIAFITVCVFNNVLFYGKMYNFEVARKANKLSLEKILLDYLKFRKTLKRENLSEGYPYYTYQNTSETLLLLTKTFIHYRAYARLARISNYLKLGLTTAE